MKHKNLILFILLLNTLFMGANSITCGENQIDNCKECGKGEQSSKCGKCEDYHFPVLNNLFCIACDDPLNGQEGCKGECNSTDFINSGIAYCQECKEGYYNDDGRCYKCSDSNPGCAICSYELEEGSYYKTIKCQKCINEEYRMNDFNRCTTCNKTLSSCKKCHFKGDKGLEAECDECLPNYSLNAEHRCKSCLVYNDVPLSNGKCYEYYNCESKPNYCKCNSGYTLNDKSCIQCLEHCEKCEYDQKTGSTNCLRCSQGYTLNSKKECVECETGCLYCDLDQNNNKICLVCRSFYDLTDDGRCLGSPVNCDSYHYDSSKKKMVCHYCPTNYALDPESGECKNCQTINEAMKSCSICQYNLTSNNYDCLSCSDYLSYSHIINTLQCLNNTKSDDKGIYGCQVSQYIESSKTYECLMCKIGSFINIVNDKSCIEVSVTGLSNYCLEAEKKGEKYSCLKCTFEKYILVEDTTTGIKNCFLEVDGLSYCVEGKLENQKYTCTKCVNNASPKDGICSCNSDSFGKSEKYCYKCNDAENGNPKCDETLGCDFSSLVANPNKKCKKCRNGFYEDKNGDCSLCISEIPNCGKCHYNNETESVICDSCVDSIYLLNTTGNDCNGLNDCDEYPEISPGCIICKDKLNEYKDKKKCQTCKYGYFKTKDEKCIYCSSEKVGGLGCLECGYKLDEKGVETDNIICKECPSYDSEDYEESKLLSKDGKCYDCQIQFSGKCTECKLISNDKGIESLKCISCINGYYLTPEGNCLYIFPLIPSIPNCYSSMFYSADIFFKFDGSKIYDCSNSDCETISSIIYSKGLSGVESKCLGCNSGYFLNKDKKCEEISFNKCSFNSIFKNGGQLRDECSTFCDYSYISISSYEKVIITIKLTPPETTTGLNIGNFDTYNYKYFIEYFINSDSIKACLNNSGDGSENAPKNLKNCLRAYYFPDNNTYACYRCKNNFELDDKTKTCQDSTCIIENLGTEILPYYQCKNSLYIYDSYVMVVNENGDKQYKHYYEDYYGDLIGCVEAKENTTFNKSKYDCTKCSRGYIPFYSKYYERNICQNIRDNITEENQDYSNIDYSKSEYEKVNAKNGICEKDTLFTPDGKNCFKCQDFALECKGKCSFSIKRNQAIKCEGKCKTGYIERSEGKCESCSDINSGCYECHYENEYPNDYNGIKRKNRFVCDFCYEGYIKNSLGECISCSNLGFPYCDKCGEDPNNKDKFICTKCRKDYFINEEGKCETCDTASFKGKDKCIDCGNASEGGINKCKYCKLDGEKVICQQCLPGYILSTDNNCLEIAKNKELEGFVNCEQITKEDNKYVCSKCIEGYSLVKKNNIKECTYIRTLYESNFETKNKMHLNFIYKGQTSYQDYSNYKKYDYTYNRYKKYYPCQEAENLGTEENPSYSCIKCYEKAVLSESDYELPVKITEINSKLSYCLSPSYLSGNNYYIGFCSEATYKIENGKELFNCTKCVENSNLYYSSDYGMHACEYPYKLTRCSIKYCKECNPDNLYVCNECFPDYDINIITGICLKKTEKVPAITWKDIYGLMLNEETKLKNEKISGPSFNIIGLTSSQIYSGHSFYIYINLEKKPRIRNLQAEEENIKMPGICSTYDEFDENKNGTNTIIYSCIGNNSNNINLNNYIIASIEDGNNESLLKSSNLKDLSLKIKEKLGGLENLVNSTCSFKLEDEMKIITFSINEPKNIEAKKFKFDIQIEGKLDKEISNKEAIKQEFILAEVEDTKANCVFNIGSELNANLNCEFSSKKHKDIKTFSFKTSEIITTDREIYFAQLDDIKLINSEESFFEKNKLYFIIGGCALGAGITGVVIFLMLRKKKLNLLKQDSGIYNPNKTHNLDGINDNNSGKRLKKNKSTKTPRITNKKENIKKSRKNKSKSKIKK